MTHLLTLEIPEKVYNALAENASKRGREIEEVAIERLSDDWPEISDDPFEKCIGSLHTDILDWADNHNKYIGESLDREMRGEVK